MASSILSLSASLALCASACTFPTVDYQDGGAGAMNMSGCNAPATCAADAQKCGDDARRAYDTCTHQCVNKPNCQPGCDSDLSISLGQCNAACQSCAAPLGCTSATASCKALVGG